MPGQDSEFEKDRKLFVGGLSYETDDQSLKEYFEHFGELTDWVVMKFPDTRRSRGFGFVTYKHPENLEDSISAGPHSIDGATVELKRATPRTAEGGRGSGGRLKGEDDDEVGPESISMRKVFIGGLSYDTTDDEMREYFEQFGELKDCVIMKFNDSKRSRGFGFVTYATAAELDHCQASRPHVIGGKTLETKRATPKRDSGRPEAQISVKKLFIGGLSDEMEDDDLRSYFGEYGNVINVEQLKFNDTGKKRGFGFIEFDDYDPVDKIVLVGKHNFKGRRLEVKKALSKAEMNMKRSEPDGAWGARDRRGGGGGGRGGRGGRDNYDDRDSRRGGGSRGMDSFGSMGNMNMNMGDMMNSDMGKMMSNMNMNMMRQMMMMNNMNMGNMNNMSRGSGSSGGGGMGGMGSFGGGMGMGMGGFGGGFENDDMPSGGGYSTGGGMGGGGSGGYGGGSGGYGGGRAGGPMRGPGGNNSRDFSAPYTRRNDDRSDRGAGGGMGRRF